jgi:raffinose/stachyose/melibiose transport system substrate-binding protein
MVRKSVSALLVIATLALSACSSPAATGGGAQPAATGATGPATTLTVWSWRIEDKDAYKKMFDAFTAKYPNITVDFQTTVDTEYETKLTTALRAGKGPDIAQLKAYGELQPLTDAGYLVPLDDKLAGLKDFYPQALDGARSVKDKKTYGVPYAMPDMGVFYNKKIFADNGISVPKTYSEFIDACKKLKAAGVTPIAAGGASGSAWALEIMVGVVGPNIYGGDAFWNDIESGKAKFTDPRFVAVLQRLQDMYPYYSPGTEGVDYTTATQQFINGQAAMFMGGAWENGSFKAQNKDLSFDIFSFPPDKAGDPAITSSFADGSYGAIAGSKNQDAALKLLDFMTTTEWAQMFADYLGWPLARPGVTPNDPVLQSLIKMQEHQTPYLTLVGFRWQTPTASEIIQADIANVMAGKMTPAALAQKVQDGVSTWFKP